MASAHLPLDPDPPPKRTAFDVLARLDALDQRVAQAELEERHRREASFIACPSSSAPGGQTMQARYEALTREEGDDYEGRTAEERLSIEMADRQGKGFGRRVRRQLYLQDGLRRIEAMRRWAYEQRQRTLAAIGLGHGRRLPACAFTRQARCARPRAFRSVARAARGTRAGPSHSSEGDPEHGGSPGAVNDVEAVHVAPPRARRSWCLA